MYSKHPEMQDDQNRFDFNAAPLRESVQTMLDRSIHVAAKVWYGAAIVTGAAVLAGSAVARKVGEAVDSGTEIHP